MAKKRKRLAKEKSAYRVIWQHISVSLKSSQRRHIIKYLMSEVAKRKKVAQSCANDAKASVAKQCRSLNSWRLETGAQRLKESAICASAAYHAAYGARHDGEARRQRMSLHQRKQRKA